ncbi:hypothetical protein DPMN_099178 [Dreissena polymorpha]|uniref:Uncharacterized protein n=1 Tax=Dreissena polymorpha TaxID=45954 RepID=A0A9D4LGM3_DREPO|nr:hypothetical protein DPMN_099178 [Dreissena polymorpha]
MKTRLGFTHLPINCIDILTPIVGELIPELKEGSVVCRKQHGTTRKRSSEIQLPRRRLKEANDYATYEDGPTDDDTCEDGVTDDDTCKDGATDDYACSPSCLDMRKKIPEVQRTINQPRVNLTSRLTYMLTISIKQIYQPLSQKARIQNQQKSARRTAPDGAKQDEYRWHYLPDEDTHL